MTKIDSFNLGVASEFIVAGVLIEQGYDVLLPFDRRGKYDLVIIKDGQFKKVQVKRANWTNPPHTTSKYLRVMTSSRGVIYTPEDIDLFAFLDCDKRVWLVPVEEVGDKKIISLDKITTSDRNWTTKERFEAERWLIS